MLQDTMKICIFAKLMNNWKNYDTKASNTTI